MYNDKVKEAFANPKNVGFIENADGVGKVGNAACGDIMEISLKIEDDRIVDAKFRTFGCAAAIATSSTATEMVKGMTLDEALNLTDAEVVEELEGLPPQKIHCSVLAEEAIKKALADYYIRNGMSEEEANEKCGVVETSCDHCHASKE